MTRGFNAFVVGHAGLEANEFLAEDRASFGFGDGDAFGDATGTGYGSPATALGDGFGAGPGILTGDGTNREFDPFSPLGGIFALWQPGLLPAVDVVALQLVSALRCAVAPWFGRAAWTAPDEAGWVVIDCDLDRVLVVPF